MRNGRIGWLVAPLLAIVAVGALAKPKPRAPCKAYVIVSEYDRQTVGLQMYGLTKPQQNWYRKHGENGKVAGLCVLHPQSQIAADEFFALVEEGKKDGTLNPDAPIYGIFWGEGPVNRLSAANRYSGPPKHVFVAWGRLELWTPTARGGKGDFVPLAPLRNHNRTALTSASTSLLKDGLEQIAEREGPKR